MDTNLSDPDIKTADRARPHRIAYLSVALVIMALALLYIFFGGHPVLQTIEHQFNSIVANAGPWGWLVIIALMVLHSFVPLPLEFAALAAGAAYGFWWGTLITVVGAVLGAALSFWLSRRFGQPFFDRVLKQNQRDWLTRQSRDQGAITLLLVRLLPFISFTLISYAAGLTRVSWWTFLWTTTIGILPITALAVLYGANMSTMPVGWLIAIPLISVSLVLGLHYLAKKKGWGN